MHYRLSILLASLLSVACESPDNRPVGLMDDAATLSCERVSVTATPLTAATSAGSASDAVITVSETPYLITLPEGARGFAALRTVDMHITVALFTREREAIEAIDGPELSATRQHAVCSAQLGDDRRVHIHTPGDYALTFAADGPREILLLALTQSIGHPDMDGGHHEHDGGTHHDHDGGEHEHDGGTHHHHDGGEHAHDGGEHAHDATP